MAASQRRDLAILDLAGVSEIDEHDEHEPRELLALVDAQVRIEQQDGVRSVAVEARARRIAR
jgi:hypothetical protein